MVVWFWWGGILKDMVPRTATARPRKRPRTPNLLWLYRKRLGFSQKQVATLLGHHTTSHVSDYERGVRRPSLETVLKLSIILRMPTAGLYQGLYPKLKRQVQKARKRLNLHYDH